MPRGWIFFSTSITVNCTSALVNGWPSWNFTFGCSLKVIVLPSGLTVQDWASPGCGFRLKSYSSRPSYTLVLTWPIGPDVLWYAASVGGSGWTTMTSVPPLWGVPCAKALPDPNERSATAAHASHCDQERRVRMSLSP